MKIDIGVAKSTPVGIPVVGVAMQTCHWVLTVRVATHGTGITAIGGVDGERGVELQDIL